jgi:hypothetical protein
MAADTAEVRLLFKACPTVNATREEGPGVGGTGGIPSTRLETWPDSSGAALPGRDRRFKSMV